MPTRASLQGFLDAALPPGWRLARCGGAWRAVPEPAVGCLPAPSPGLRAEVWRFALDRETRSRFQETYNKVNEGLARMFPRLFGGGHAELHVWNDLPHVFPAFADLLPEGREAIERTAEFIRRRTAAVEADSQRAGALSPRPVARADSA